MRVMNWFHRIDPLAIILAIMAVLTLLSLLGWHP
jgi:hypothetical protein